MQQLAVQGQEAHLTAGQTGQDRVQVPVQETAPAQEQNCREFLIVPEQGEAVTEQEETQPSADTYVVTGNKVNVRTEPSANGRILVQLEGGTEVVYVNRYNNDWTVINYDGQEAYISSQYIAKQEAETDAQPQEEAAAESESVTN